MRTRNDLLSGADILDSRDIIARLDELADERETLADELNEAENARNDCDDERADLDEALTAARAALAEWDADNGDELNALRDFADELAGYGDWKHGETLIRESYFEDYARELAADIGALDGADNWPLTCIDWEKAADELRHDYTSADLGGVTYLMRC